VKKSDRDAPIVSPVDFYPGSNGETPPEPPTRRQIEAYGQWQRIVEEKHKRLGMTRRQFAESACGLAAALWVNQAACGGGRNPAGGGAGGSAGTSGSAGATSAGGAGGSADGGAAGASGSGGASGMDAAPDGTSTGGDGLSRDMMEDADLARERLMGDEFVFDVHTHPPEMQLVQPWMAMRPDRLALDYIAKVFVQTDTAMAVMTGWPSARRQNEVNVRANAMLGEIVDRLGGDRYRFHANAEPDLAGEPDYIQRLASQFENIAAWKVYPASSATTRLHQRTDFLERVRATGIKIVAGHRGLSGNGGYSHPGSPEDMVRAALLFPDIKFLVYHSAFESAAEEDHPYQDLGEQTKGVDRFVKAMLWAQQQNGGQPLQNVYADLGTTWSRVMGSASTASHVVGKLLKYVGADEVLFGTDALNVGTPHATQIAAMRIFDTLPAHREPAIGYPAVTPELRRKIFGLNAAAVYGVDPQAIRYRISNDDVSKLRMAYREDPRSVPTLHPHFHRGPRTVREFFALRERQHRFGLG
jgi:predicted TIM-barrel fold metal-dependent hydrolase